MPKKKGRTKIFKDGKKAVNISRDVYDKIEKEAEKSTLYPSQFVDNILRKHFKLEG